MFILKEQLDQFEAERLSLMQQNSSTESDLRSLSERYAKLLGHQNNRQKIHHVKKLNDENLSLKKVSYEGNNGWGRGGRGYRYSEQKADLTTKF